MKSIQELCKPREVIFTEANREDALNLADLIQNKIKPEKFFGENYITGGMERLLHTAFERFEGKSSVSVIKLTQAMGGGKTHNMIALGLLAKHPELREKFKSDIQFKQSVRVVAFSGRESDAPYGIWGSIAEQLGKLELFEKYYRPLLQAPGETAWINLLQGEPILILLDELPPYFTSTASTPVGNSDLSVVTTTALSNLLVAVNKADLANVLIVISDLRASYESGSQKLNEALQNFDKETNRTALNLEPVQLNSNEVYQILRKKIFDKLPNEAEIKEVSIGFADEIRKAKKWIC
ncbi:MAG: DUF499 domain-containing protein [Leptospiraceae bacterium]|nr:DUF499 domain-containing protein [Leptospiraceae bacterium]